MSHTTEEKVKETRQAGAFEFELPSEGFPLNKLIMFAEGMFPGVAHDNLIILPAEEGKICIANAEGPIKFN